MISFLSLAHSVILRAATPSPEPSVYPEYEGDVNLVTPGVIGFAFTLFIAVAVVLIVMDMNRRIRRVRYRALAQETIRNEQELAAADGTGTDSGVDATTDATTGTATNTESDKDLPPTPRAD